MDKPSGWQRWLRQPSLLRWRQVVVQVHLWVGLALGLYIVVISVSGSLAVLRVDVNRWAVPRSVTVEGTRLTGDELREAVRLAYPSKEVTDVFEPRPRRTPRGVPSQSAPREAPVDVRLQLADGTTEERLFDQYAGRDLGLAYPPIVEAMEWVVELHDYLLMGSTGRMLNGIGALLLLALAVTGLIVWWPGVNRVRHALVPGLPALSSRFARRLHNTLGFWLFLLILLWAVTGVYFAFPDPFERIVDYFDEDLTDVQRPDGLVRLLVNIHFGRQWGMTVKWVWVVLGLVPAALFITGFITWWARVVRRRKAGNAAAAQRGEASPPLAGEGIRN